jgi:hypothetical protein
MEKDRYYYWRYSDFTEGPAACLFHDFGPPLNEGQLLSFANYNYVVVRDWTSINDWQFDAKNAFQYKIELLQYPIEGAEDSLPHPRIQISPD